MRLAYLGHSAFLVEASGHEILIDPFLSGNARAAVEPRELSPDYVIITHAHGDHVGDTEEIARRSGATVVSNVEVCKNFAAKGLETHGMNVGGPWDFPFGTLTFTPAWHSSSFPDGSYGGMPMGVVIEAEGKAVYHAGDTALFSDMELIGARGLDVALLPIGGNFTMGPAEAIHAARLLQADTVVPIHYDTFDVIRQDAEEFRRQLEATTDCRAVVLEPGRTLEP